MKFCTKCGAEIGEGIKFCPSCGAATDVAAEQPKVEATQKTGNDAEDNKTMAILAYLLFFVPLATGDYKKSPFVKYHLNQGILLWGVSIIWSIIFGILTSVIKVNNCGGYSSLLGDAWCKTTPTWLYWVGSLVGLGIGVLGVIGILNAIKGEKKPVPLLGNLKIELLK